MWLLKNLILLSLTLNDFFFQPEFLIKWLGYNKKSDNTWEPKENLQDCTDAVMDFEKERKGYILGKKNDQNCVFCFCQIQ